MNRIFRVWVALRRFGVAGAPSAVRGDCAGAVAGAAAVELCEPLGKFTFELCEPLGKFMLWCMFSVEQTNGSKVVVTVPQERHLNGSNE